MSNKEVLEDEIKELTQLIGDKTIELDQLNKQLADLLNVRRTFNQVEKNDIFKKRLSELLKGQDGKE